MPTGCSMSRTMVKTQCATTIRHPKHTYSIVKIFLGKWIMKFSLLRTLILVSTFACGSANANIYNYTGNTLSGGGHLTATADVTFSGAGSYIYGNGLNSFAISSFDHSNMLLGTSYSSAAGSNRYVNYITFDGSENVTNWFMYSMDADSGLEAATAGYDRYTPSIGSFGSQDGFYIPIIGNEYNFHLAGTWASSVPEPTSLTLLGLGLAGLGFVSRRKRA